MIGQRLGEKSESNINLMIYSDSLSSEGSNNDLCEQDLAQKINKINESIINGDD